MYLGHSPTNAGSFIFLDDIASGFNGSETQFTLQVGGVSITPNTQNLLIALDGIIQQAPDAYTTSGSTITFTGAVLAVLTSMVFLWVNQLVLVKVR